MNLVPNRWYAILDPDEVPADRPVAFRRMGRDLVFWRDAEGKLRAADDRCPHRGSALSIGKVEGGCITCPFHGFRFEPDGRCSRIPAHPERRIPAAMHLRTLPVREAHELVWAWSGPDPAPEADPPFFDFSGHSWRGSQFTSAWPVHYSRAVENQLDWAHLAFVHESTIGRFAPADVDDVRTRTEGDHIWCGLPDNPEMLHVLGPNLWTMPTGPFTRGFLVFAPIDDENMIYYSRAYQSAVRVPGADWLFGVVNRWMNQYILSQDKRVVSTQTPRISALDNGEVYVKSDQPIIAYLRWRQALRSGGAADLERSA
ncbi:MAG: aromatic ring-hydroxylating dioxygenase subunit alpha [Alphaproteobacteria bacterium]|nr:aromatic ring-hydroxylating dioxygenase subunit alpha [Alphaproteobacteria bacterium]